VAPASRGEGGPDDVHDARDLRGSLPGVQAEVAHEDTQRDALGLDERLEARTWLAASDAQIVSTRLDHAAAHEQGVAVAASGDRARRGPGELHVEGSRELGGLVERRGPKHFLQADHVG